MLLNVKVKPNSKKSKITKQQNGFFNVFVKSPAHKGAANKETIKLIATYFNVSKSQIKIKIGKTSRIKIFEII